MSSNGGVGPMALVASGVMEEIQRQYCIFVATFGENPTEVTMHPMVYATLLSTVHPSKTLYIQNDDSGELKIMGMKVNRDPEFPGIQILVS
jgi:hypothetical protein